MVLASSINPSFNVRYWSTYNLQVNGFISGGVIMIGTAASTGNDTITITGLANVATLSCNANYIALQVDDMGTS
jgi:hypothetical protein